MRIRKRILVSGRVQGVFFREGCRRLAQEKGIAGGARNLSDGRLEVVAEGGAEAVDAMVDFCRQGPSMARVQRVDVIDEEPEGQSGFSVR